MFMTSTTLLNNRFLLLILLVLYCSCRKENTVYTTSTFTLTNPYGEMIYADIYRTDDDYNRETKGCRFAIPANTTITLIYPPFETGERYIVDWYNRSYTITNWSISTDTFVPTGAANDGYTIAYDANKYRNSARGVWLHGSAETNWKTADVYGRGQNGTYVSIAQYLTENQKYFALNVKKNGVAVIDRKDVNGQINTQYLFFQSTNSFPVCTAYLNHPANIRVLEMMSNFTIASTDNYTPNTDTILVRTTTDTLTFYKLVRQ